MAKGAERGAASGKNKVNRGQETGQNRADSSLYDKPAATRCLLPECAHPPAQRLSPTAAFYAGCERLKTWPRTFEKKPPASRKDFVCARACVGEGVGVSVCLFVGWCVFVCGEVCLFVW